MMQQIALCWRIWFDMAVLLSIPLNESQQVLSLQEALARARAHHPQAQQIQAQTQEAAAQRDLVRAEWLPQLSVDAGAQRLTSNFVFRPGAVPRNFATNIRQNSNESFSFWQFGASVTQLLFDFCQVLARWQASASTLAAKQQLWKATLLQVEARVRQAYYAVHAAQALAQVQQEAVAQQQRAVVQTEQMIAAGSRPTIDAAKLRASLGQAELGLLQAAHQVDLAYQQLHQAMGALQGEHIALAVEGSMMDAEEEQTLDVLQQQAFAQRPEMVQLKFETRAQEQLLQAHWGRFAPSFSVKAAVSEQGQSLAQLTWNWNAQLLLQWAVFDGGATLAQIQRQKAVLLGLEAQNRLLQQQIVRELHQALQAIVLGKRKRSALAKAVHYAQESLILAQKRYQQGVGSVIELADSQLTLTTAQSQQVEATFEIAMGRAALWAALGNLEEKL